MDPITLVELALNSVSGEKLHVSDGYYSLKRSRTNGEKDLFELAQKSEVEAAFYFDAGNSVWHYSSIFPSNSQAQIPFTHAGSFGDKVTVYHYHPSINLNENLKSAIAELKEDETYRSSPIALRREMEKQMKIYYTLLHSLPSVDVDYPKLNEEHHIFGDLNIFSIIQSRSRDVSLDFKLITMFGILTLKFEKDADIETAISRYGEAFSTENIVSYIGKDFRDSMDRAISEMNRYMNGLMALSFKYQKNNFSSQSQTF